MSPASAKAGAATESSKPLAVTVACACDLIGVGRTTIWRLVKDGYVDSIKIGRRRLVVFASLEALAAGRGEQRRHTANVAVLPASVNPKG